eukprot:ANDGO_01010.mRNA.1 Actin-like protein arp6
MLLDAGSLDALGKVIVDVGAHSVKIGTVAMGHLQPLVVPAVLCKRRGSSRIFLGEYPADSILEISIRRAHEQGYLTQPDILAQILLRAFSQLNVDPSRSHLLITLPLFTPPTIQKYLFKILFDDFKFSVVSFVPAAQVVAFGLKDEARACLLVDSGYSFTYVVPVVDQRIKYSGVRRLGVGGKHISNFLKEQISFRQVNVSDENVLVERIKHETVFCAANVEDCMAECKQTPNGVRRDVYVSQTEIRVVQGAECIWERRKLRAAQMESQDPIIPLSVERFMTPEALFEPQALLGISQCGMHEAVVDSYKALPEIMGLLAIHRMHCFGGNFSIPGLFEKLTGLVRSLVEEDILGTWTVAQDPVREVFYVARSKFDEIVSSDAVTTMTLASYQKRGPVSAVFRFVNP